MSSVLQAKEKETIRNKRTEYLLHLIKTAILNSQFHVQGVIEGQIKELYVGSLSQCQGFLHAMLNDPYYTEVAVTTGGLDPLIILHNTSETVDKHWQYVYNIHCPKCTSNLIRHSIISGIHECNNCGKQW